MKRRIAALLGSAALLFAIAGVATATAASDQGITPTAHDGNIKVVASGNNDGANCEAADGVESNTADDLTTDNGVEVVVTYNSDTKAVSFTATGGLVTEFYVKGGNGYNEYDYTGTTDGGVTSDGHLYAPDNGSDGPAGLSHWVACTTVAGSTSAPTPSDNATPTPDTGGGGDTATPSLPSTDAISGTGTSAPSDAAWLLVVGLGVLLASVVVLTPARAKSRR